MWNIPNITKLILIIKPGKESSCEVSKYRPISLLHLGATYWRKSWLTESVTIHGYMNNNQNGFIPQASTIDAAKAVKDVIEEGLNVEIIVIVSVDVEGALNAAWWPSILKSHKICGCPQNLYNLKKSYFNQRAAILQTTNIKLEEVITKVCPQGSCSGPGYWNIQYNSLLNINFTNRTKAVAFADDLILMARGKRVKEAESITNLRNE